MHRPSGMRALRRILGTRVVWRLSGISYCTAVIATHGVYVPVDRYVRNCARQVDPLLPFIPSRSTVLEFGSGLGGNLIALSPRLSAGVGLDVNRGYTRIARSIARLVGVGNVTFLAYNGLDLPDGLPRFDVIFSIGVFERLNQNDVKRYIGWMISQLAPTGTLCLYFLAPRALESGFVKLLGAEAYVVWTQDQVLGLLSERSLRLRTMFPWRPTGMSPSESVADMYVASLE